MILGHSCYTFDIFQHFIISLNFVKLTFWKNPENQLKRLNMFDMKLLLTLIFLSNPFNWKWDKGQGQYSHVKQEHKQTNMSHVIECGSVWTPVHFTPLSPTLRSIGQRHDFGEQVVCREYSFACFEGYPVLVPLVYLTRRWNFHCGVL